MPRIDRSSITDADGRHIPLVRREIPGSGSGAGPARKSEETALAVAKPRNGKELQRQLDALSSKVRRLSPPMSSNPERFHEERSEIARELQRLAEWAGKL